MAMIPKSTEIVVGIASYNNAATIGRVVRAVHAGLVKYFPGKSSLIINSDGGSTDGTPGVVLSACPHRGPRVTSVPYSGIPGKGSALRAVFETAVRAGARACCVVDADLRSITPEWVELLLAPVLAEGFDFVAPLYSRHKYDGTITNSIVYPMTRSLYGRKIRQPIGGEFGFSGDIARFYLNQDVWDTHVARFGIDIWMTTEAIANGFKVCQAFLGAKVHDPKDPASSLSDMLTQVVATLFGLAEKHFDRWKDVTTANEIMTFGAGSPEAVEPVTVDAAKMLDAFRQNAPAMEETWTKVLDGPLCSEIEEIANAPEEEFTFPSGLWTKVVFNYAASYHRGAVPAEELVKSLIPLYLARTASFVRTVRFMDQPGAEAETENICLEFERNKGYLISKWL